MNEQRIWNHVIKSEIAGLARAGNYGCLAQPQSSKLNWSYESHTGEPLCLQELRGFPGLSWLRGEFGREEWSATLAGLKLNRDVRRGLASLNLDDGRIVACFPFGVGGGHAVLVGNVLVDI